MMHLEHSTSRSAPLKRHEYNRCTHSGAGNCCCGYARESVVHPHVFTPAYVNPFRCVCSKPPNWNGHLRSVPGTTEGQSDG
jgi:hypothetical protein